MPIETMERVSRPPADIIHRSSSQHGPLSVYLRIDENKGRFEVDQRAYTDDMVFRRERDLIFSKCWLYIGHDTELRKPKDFLTRNVGGQDLIFHRDRNGKVHAFHNYCPHRGPVLEVNERGNTGTFMCPYHGWVFDGAGKLRDCGAAGGYDADFNSDGRYDLLEVPRLESYRGFYFINFNPNAIDLQSYLGGSREVLDLMVDQAEGGLEVIGGEQHLVNGGNWKVLTDNFVDMYHGPALHKSYFSYVPERTGNKNIMGGFHGRSGGLGGGHNLTESFLGLGRPVAVWIPAFGEAVKPVIEGKKAELLARWGEERGERMCTRNRNMTIFPNMVITDNISISIRTVYPDAVDSFRMHISALGCVGEPDALRDVRLRNHLSFVGPAGFAHPDDFELFDRLRQAYHTTPHKWLDMSKGMKTNVIPDGDRRLAYGELLDEAQQRAWWTQWDRMISGAESLE